MQQIQHKRLLIIFFLQKTYHDARLSYQLRELEEELESTAGDLVDFVKMSDFPSSSRSDTDPAVSVKQILSVSNRLGKLAQRVKSTAGSHDSVNNVRHRQSDSLAVGLSSSEDVVVVCSEEDPSYSSAVRSSSGLDEDLIAILDRLTGDSSLQVLPIVGMGGIGKTTLAKIVYDHSLVCHHFDIRAWVTVSQEYNVKSVFLDLLEDILQKRGRQSNKDSDFNLEIYRSLIGRRYLIVMDDVWSNEFWDEVRFLFPNSNNGSRIIVTTRLQDVAAYITRYGYMHRMRLLDADQSWDLFQQKVFGDHPCPPELRDVAQKIVRRCGGLPLAIVKVAELLSANLGKPRFWEQIAASDEQLESVQNQNLPHPLKQCFLYMAGFPQDYEIRTSEIIKLWVAEGFLESSTETTSLEDEAERCLEDLVNRSLVMVSSRKVDGKIRSFRLHNMVRDFCIRQAGLEKFLVPVMEYALNPIVRRHLLPRVLKACPRISVSWSDLHLKNSMNTSCTETIICIPQKGYRPKGSVRDFISLKVLHVLRRDDDSYWELGQVFDLVHLTYLASNIPSSRVPSAISKLQNLQTMIIYRYEVELPVEIWRLPQLRHLIAFSFKPLPHPEAAYPPLENLQTLSFATDFVFSQRMVVMIEAIKKLGICYSGEKFEGDCHLNNLAHLHRLEKLKLEWPSSFCPSLPVLPQSLTKLYLSGGRLPWRDMTIIGSLPKLQVLKLRNYAFSEEQWDTIEGEFLQLKFLLIDESDLKYWRTESSHFPFLKCLMLHRCPYLYEIPSDIGEIPTLELIEVDNLNRSVLHSAKMIQQDLEELGHYGIQVRVKRY